MPKGPKDQKVKPLTEAQKCRLEKYLSIADSNLAVFHRQRAGHYRDPKYPAATVTEKRKADNKANRKEHLRRANEAERRLAERGKRDA